MHGILALAGALALGLGGAVIPLQPAHADVSTTVNVTLGGAREANAPIPNSGCYPSGVMTPFATVEVSAAGVGATVSANIQTSSSAVTAALYSGSFLADNTVAYCQGRTVQAPAGGAATLNWAFGQAGGVSHWVVALFSPSPGTTARLSLTSTGMLSVSGQPLSILTTSLPAATRGSDYSAGVDAVDGQLPYRFAVSGLPAGLSIDPATGVIAGVPGESGMFTPAVTITDAASPAQTVTRRLRLEVASGAAVPTPPPTTPPATASPTPSPTSTAPPPPAAATPPPPRGSNASRMRSGATLAETGSDLSAPLAAGACIIAGGVALLVVTERRRRRARRER